MNAFRKARRVVQKLLFPPKCALCDRLLEGEEEGLCRLCRKETADNVPPVRKDSGIICISALAYGGDVRESLHRYKFSGRTSYSKAYALLLAERLYGTDFQRVELITWAPISPRRKRQRGYDQSELVARRLSELMCIPLAATLRKTRNNPKQSSLRDAARRQENVRNVYAVTDPKRVQGRRILLVDDIVTTGATLRECSRVLREAGAEAVLCATVAQAQD